MKVDEVIETFNDPDIGLDGKWSSQTKFLLAKVGAQHLELNKWWALTPQNWKCPSCEKPKQELVKLSHSKCLIAKLVSHHDHAKESIEAQAPFVWLSDGTIEPTACALREHLKRLANGFLSRFPPTIICEGCNNLEPVLKKRLCIPSIVTLTPSEINKLRNYNRATVDKNLENLISQLLEWANFIKRHVDLAIQSFRLDLHPANKGWFYAEDSVRRRAASALNGHFDKRTRIETEPLAEFLNLSVAVHSGVKLKNSDLPQPTEFQFRSFKHPQPIRQKVIDETPDDWKCPICFRSKYECFTASRGRRKIFMLNLMRRKIDFDFGQFEEVAIICGHCNDFQNEFARYCRNNGILEEFLKPSETQTINADAVRCGIKSTPHQRHEVDFDAAIAFLYGPYDGDADLDSELEY